MLIIKPSNTLKVIEKGEELQYTIDVSNELYVNDLSSMTIAAVNFSIFDSDSTSVDDDYNGGVSYIGGIISFGIKAFDVGKFKMEFIVTCVETLPDGVTPYEFIFYMYVNIKDI